MGVVTLLMAPLGWVICGFPSVSEYLQLDKFVTPWTIIGLCYGVVVGYFMLAISNLSPLTERYTNQVELIRSMKLTVFDALFLSLCAGFGEEFLFRVGIQHWVHPLIVTIVFVAVHGYLDPRSWAVSKFGLVVTAFISVFAFAVSDQGIWFCVAGHASYDAVLFLYWRKHSL